MFFICPKENSIKIYDRLWGQKCKILLTNHIMQHLLAQFTFLIAIHEPSQPTKS